jgi:hypothetical protein
MAYDFIDDTIPTRAADNPFVEPVKGLIGTNRSKSFYVKGKKDSKELAAEIAKIKVQLQRSTTIATVRVHTEYDDKRHEMKVTFWTRDKIVRSDKGKAKETATADATPAAVVSPTQPFSG